MPGSETLYFIAPKKLEVREFELPAINENEVLVESLYSAISAGTEMLVYRGEFPNLEDVHDNFSSGLKYPTPYGYACVGKVIEIGKKVSAEWKDKLVFAFQPHATHFITTPDSLLSIPAGCSPLNACFLPNMETAVNFLQDGAPLLGERVLVLGQGVVGLMTASLLSEFPLEKIVTADHFPKRLEASAKIDKIICSELSDENHRQVFANLHTQKFDLTFEISGSPSALNDAINLTAFSGRIVIGSWYGQKKGNIDLGGVFHRSRIRLISSQVSTISPELSGRWDKGRRFDAAWKALERIQPEKWITHRFSLYDADKAYRLLDEHPEETIQVIFDYSK